MHWLFVQRGTHDASSLLEHYFFLPKKIKKIMEVPRRGSKDEDIENNNQEINLDYERYIPLLMITPFSC